MSTDAPSGTESPALVHPRALAPGTLIFTVLLSALGAFVGLHLITTLGISANTSVIGALLAMLMGRIGVAGLSAFRDTNRQNLAQTAISSATFGAANALLTPIAIGWAFGRPDLVLPLMFGAAAGLAVDSWVLYRTFGSGFLPASAAWPPGIAAAETIKAGDQGGHRARMLLLSGVAGVAMSWFGLNASAAGVALIGNIAALSMFGLGLMANQYIGSIPGLEDVSLSGQFIPHGIMIGAGVVALVQAAMIFFSRRPAPSEQSTEAVEDPADVPTRSPRDLGRAFGSGFVMFIGGAVVLALISGITSELSVVALIGWVLFAAVAAFVHEIIVGLAAMQAGWFPSFAVTLIFLVLGLVIGLPAVPLVVLTGYCLATGPAFADMGYDLKAGWVLRKVHSKHPGYHEYEMSGRRQQYYSAMVGFTVALVFVALLWRYYFENGLIPPVAKVFAGTIEAGLTNPDAVRNLLLWAVPGALLQFVGGAKRQMGIMLATGLLISVKYAGFLVLGALLIRLIVRKARGPEVEDDLALVAAGLIAGDALASVGKIFK